MCDRNKRLQGSVIRQSRPEVLGRKIMGERRSCCLPQHLLSVKVGIQLCGTVFWCESFMSLPNWPRFCGPQRPEQLCKVRLYQRVPPLVLKLIYAKWSKFCKRMNVYCEVKLYMNEFQARIFEIETYFQKRNFIIWITLYELTSMLAEGFPSFLTRPCSFCGRVVSGTNEFGVPFLLVPLT